MIHTNGKFIASTGEFNENPNDIRSCVEYNEFRGYYLPNGILKPDVKNTYCSTCLRYSHVWWYL